MATLIKRDRWGNPVYQSSHLGQTSRDDTRRNFSTNPSVSGQSTRTLLGTPVPGVTQMNRMTTGGTNGTGAATSGGTSTPNTALNTANAAKNATALANWNAEMAKPHGLAEGYSIDPNINFNDKVKVHGGDDYMSEHMVTYDNDLSKFNSKLTLARQWIAPKKPTLLSTDNRIDPHNEHGGGAVHGDRQDSMSDRNSSNYAGPGVSNPTNQPSGVGKTGKSGSSSGKSSSRSGSSRGSLIGGKSSSSGGYGQSPGGDNRR